MFSPLYETSNSYSVSSKTYWELVANSLMKYLPSGRSGTVIKWPSSSILDVPINDPAGISTSS